VHYLRGREARHPNELSLVALFDRAYSDRATGECLFEAGERRERIEPIGYCGGT
jgi:hypothetical protein